LSFRAVPSIDSALCAARIVEYSETVPSIASLDDWVEVTVGCKVLDHSDLHYQLTCTKHWDWRYEKEWRVITTRRPTDSGNFEDIRFHPEEFAGIYLGARITDSDRTEIMGLVRSKFPTAQAFRAAQVRNEFKLEFRPLRLV
jgi:hypothetical protein